MSLIKKHLCVEIDGEIQRIVKKGYTVLGCYPQKALSILTNAKTDGKKYWSGCDNMKEDGSCGGHPSED